MTTKPETNVDKALAYIAKHPGARAPEIEEQLGIKFVSALLAQAVESGFLVACKVERPGKPPTNEYRLSAAVAADKVSWSEFRLAKRAKLPLKLARPTPMRTAAPPPTAETPPPKAAPPLPAPIPAPQNQPIKAGPIKAVPIAPEILFLIDSTGELRIEMPDGEQFFVSRRETQSLGRLLMATEPIWSNA